MARRDHGRGVRRSTAEADGRRAGLRAPRVIVILVVLGAVAAIVATGLAGPVGLMVAWSFFAGLEAVPLLSAALLAVFFTTGCVLVRTRGRVGVGTALVLLLAATVPTSLVGQWVHGESFATSIYYEVPVEIRFEPSPAAFAALGDDLRGPFAFWNWSVEDQGSRGEGRICYPLFAEADPGRAAWRAWVEWQSAGGAAEGPFARASEPVPYDAAVEVRIPRKYIGALRFRWSSPAVRIAVREERLPREEPRVSPIRQPPPEPGAGDLLFTVPITRGTTSFEVTDRRGHIWRISTRTRSPRFARETRHIF